MTPDEELRMECIRLATSLGANAYDVLEVAAQIEQFVLHPPAEIETIKAGTTHE